MKRTSKILVATLLMVCFISTLMACSKSEVTDNKETTSTTATENKTTESTEPATTTEEPITEETTTEFDYESYKFKGEEWVIHPMYAEKFDNLTIENGFKFYINDYIITEEENSDYERGYYVYEFLYLTKPDNEEELRQYMQDNYSHYGENGWYIPKDDNFCIEYKGTKKIVFELVYIYQDGGAIFDVHEIE